MSNLNRRVHIIGNKGTLTKITMKRGTTKYHDLEYVKPDHTILNILHVHRILTDKKIIYVAASRTAEALNIVNQLGYKFKEFMEPEEAPGE